MPFFVDNSSSYISNPFRQNIVKGSIQLVSIIVILLPPAKQNPVNIIFPCLHEYQDKEYWQAHQEVVFETPAGAESYRIVAVLRVKGSYRAGEWSIFQPMDVDSQTVEEITTHRLYDTAVGIGPGDKLLTLVTCEYSQKNGRLAVIAVKE